MEDMEHAERGPLVLALDDAAATLERVGGKGASLARMAAAGLPVPRGFYVTTAAYRRFVAENALREPILAAASAVQADQPASLEAASRHISELFARGAMPDAIAEAIRQAYVRLGGGDQPVAVRSSATAEDLPELSFAGQQETYLNMRGDAMLLDAVKRCWASLWTARAIGYRARQGIAPQAVSLAVVVQELVPADAAGVLFTANPLTGARDQMMLNAVWGLGESLVGGHVTPDTLVLDGASGTLLAQELRIKDVMTVRTRDGTREVPVPPDRRAEPVLTLAQAAELARLGARIERLYGRPMDVEWAIHAGRVYILQARPITALPEPAPQRPAADWTLPKPDGRYVRASVLELLPDPLSPLFATLGLPAWSEEMLALMRRLRIDLFSGEPLVTINGYGYYDYSFTLAQTVKLVLAMPRLLIVESSLPRNAEPRWRAAHARYADMVRRWEAADLAAAPATSLLSGARELTAEAAHYYVTVQSGLLPAAYTSELLFTLAYTRVFRRRDMPAALTFLLGFDSTPIRAEKSLYDLARWVRGHPDLAAALASMSDERFLAAYHERSPRAVDGAWPAFWRRLDEHLARFGHAVYDLDFAKPVLTDDPTPILETLTFFLSDQAPNPRERQAAAAAAREQATQRMRARHGLHWRLLRRVMERAQHFAPLREDALADAGLGWPVLRRMLREVGQRLAAARAFDTPDDVFWLTLDELEAAATALDAGHPPASAHAVIAERRATWERQRALTPPVALPPESGARFLGINFSSMMPARASQPAGDVLRGIAASPGRVTGAARVIHGPDEFAGMQPGDILVARITTPAWTPLFALAAAVVTDVGGPLSHGSIVAREYHIPAVLGTGTATERLANGQRVTVDGDAGTVTVAR